VPQSVCRPLRSFTHAPMGKPSEIYIHLLYIYIIGEKGGDELRL
jgi:hypothetical protein